MTGYVRNDTANNIADGKVANASDIDGEFDAIVDAFDNSTGHSHDGSAAEGAPIEVIGPNQDFLADGSSFTPKTDSAYTLGTVSVKWSNGYFDALNVDGSDVVTADSTDTFTNKTVDISANTFTVDGTEEVGFKRVPVLTTTGRTLATTDVGKLVSSTGTITIPNSTFSAGDILTVYNNTSSDLTVTCTITTAYIAGVNTDEASVTIATRGFATITFLGGTECVISGNVS